MGSISLTKEQIAYIVEKLGISDEKQALERFVELMAMENIHPQETQRLIRKMMQRERNQK